VRLAFAVAAHLDPEILIVDEVLAVGDAEFQKKCLGKMSDVASEGRTVLFVSHNMAAVRAICTSALLLSRGKVVERGAVGEVLSVYARQTVAAAGTTVSFEPSETKPQFLSLSLPEPTVEYGGELEIRGQLSSPTSTSVAVEVEIHDERGMPIAYMATAPVGTTLFPLSAGVVHDFSLRLGPLPLATGQYSLYFWLIRPWAENYHVPPAPLVFEVIHSDPGRSGFEFRQSYGRGAATIPMEATFR
jgi:lipopolysaccharide transport system ATP-binding protein